MSARASGQVWKLSQHKGSELLVLLAIADNAKDDGRDAWPSIPELARKTRLTERNIQMVLRKLEQSGELIIEKNAGPNRANLYHIVLNGEKIAPSHPEKIAPSDGEEIAPVKSFQGEIQRTERVKSSVQNDAIPPKPPYKEELIKLTVNEPSVRERTPATPSAYPIDFETWWQACPPRMRRCGKSEAVKAWKGLNGSRPPVATMLDVLALQAGSHDWTKDGGQYIPMATTYLHKRRWEADVGSMEIGAEGHTSPHGRYLTAAEKHDAMLMRFMKGNTDERGTEAGTGLSGGNLPARNRG